MWIFHEAVDLELISNRIARWRARPTHAPDAALRTCQQIDLFVSQLSETGIRPMH